MMHTNWEEVARRRLRLFYAGLTIGLLLGVIVGMAVMSPPWWIGELNA